MITIEFHPEIYAREQHRRPEYSTCYECHRSFHAKSEDQLSVGLCNTCFDAARQISEPVVSIHVKVLPHHPIVL
jgi:hypothetical protein